MTKLLVAGRKAARKSANMRVKKPYQFRLGLVRYKEIRKEPQRQHETHSHLCYRLIARELCALTLLSNSQLMLAIRSVADYWAPLADQHSARLPKDSAQKEWISQLIKSSGLGNDLASAIGRKKKLQEIVVPKHNVTAEHVSVRAYPVRCLMPQNNYQARNYLLLVAFHLTEGWLSLRLAEMQDRWQKGNVLDFESAVSRMLAPRILRAFMTQLDEAFTPRQNGLPRKVIFHAQAGDEPFWRGLLDEQWEMKFDMPKADFGKDRLVIKCTTRAHLKVPRYQLPGFGNSMPDCIEVLPRLDSMKHEDKNKLIHVLWNELLQLRGAAKNT